MLQLQPSQCDAEHLGGTLLQRVGRSTALDFAAANIKLLVTDISEHLQVVAVPAQASQRLDVDRAALRHADVFLFGIDLKMILREADLFQVVPAESGITANDCTMLSQVSVA